MDTSPIRVLHVDDEPSFVNLTREFIEREDDRFTIETATSADKGLDKIKHQPPDCVVSDYDMPGKNGIEFLKAVRETTPDLPFILFTGKGSESVASDAMAAGVTDYLQKGSGAERYELLANRIMNAVQAQRATEETTRQRELMRLTELAGDTGGWELDLETEEFRLTDGTRRLTGICPTDTLTLEGAINMYHPDDRDEVQTAVDNAVQTGTQTGGTWRFQPRDSTKERIVDVTITPATSNGDVTTLRGAINDITDIQKRQQELRILQQAIDDATVPISLADPSQDDTPLVYVNSAYKELTGYSEAEALGRNCRYLQGEDTDPEKVATLRKAINNEESATVTLRNYRKDGTEFWNRLRVTPIYDDDGTLIRYLGSQRDVTERIERQRELESKRRFIEQSLNAIDDLFYVLDTDGTLRRWNEQISEVTGYTDQDLTGIEATELFPETEREANSDVIKMALSDGQNTTEADLRTADGELLPYEFTHAQLTDVDGNTTGLVGIGRSLTDKNDREYRELAKEYEALLETSGDAIFILDVDTNGEDPTFEFARLSAGYEAQTGISTENVRGKTPQAVFGSERGAELEANYTRCVEQRAPVSYQEELDIADDARIWETSLAPIVIDDEVTRIVGIARNVTEQVERERRIQQQNKRLEEFTNVVSHDLQSPLGVAEGHLELAGVGDENEHLVKATDAIERGQALINDLLTLAQEGDRVGESEPVDLREVAKKSWQTTETARATLKIGGSGVIEGDRDRIQQLLENLYRNAVEHGGDDVTVHVGEIGGGFYVADTGLGISKSDRKEVFDAGYSTSEDGTGFGLRIVEQIVTAHGWDITVTESEQGGARFEITGVKKVN